MNATKMMFSLQSLSNFGQLLNIKQHFGDKLTASSLIMAYQFYAMASQIPSPITADFQG